MLPCQFEKVAVRMLEQPELIAFESAATVANKCGVSQTTVVRLAHHLGVGSYRRLKKLCSNHILDRTWRSQ
jgi:DNA-binding MurR/RpiR family transcriptional regulator